MKSYEDIKKRFDSIFDNEECPLTRKEAEKLYQDMCEFIKEDHPEKEIRSIYPIGMMESLGMLLDDSDPKQPEIFKQSTDK